MWAFVSFLLCLVNFRLTIRHFCLVDPFDKAFLDKLLAQGYWGRGGCFSYGMEYVSKVKITSPVSA